ncbi:LegC family aminotransferase [Gracilibacillus marinus]|uniref:LegC family aminotransferase n=1 Tax=Gracilibacillus marinus TaxID=630535 RepID=A0ABV8VUT2_9BACI
MIPLSVPNLKGNELKYVSEAINDEWVSTGGSFINKFEKNIAEYVGVNNAVACQSGTAGLHLALTLTDVQHNDEVIVPTLTFIAAVNPVSYLGANPIFMDCDDSLCLDPVKLEQFCQTECQLTSDGLVNNNTKRVIKAIIVVHVFGNMANMEEIMNIANKYQLKVIEDATEALGTYYIDGKYKGSYAGTIGDFGVYSFNGNKIITTGGGGMFVAKDSEMADKARYLSTQAKDDTLYYVHNEIGYNYRMTNLQAALGVAQLEQLESFIETKKENYNVYKEHIQSIDGLDILNFNKDIRPNYWFYSLVIDESKFSLSRDTLLKKLEEKKIQTRPIWGLIHEQKPYQNAQSYHITNASIWIEKILNIPCSSNLTKEDVLQVINEIRNLK